MLQAPVRMTSRMILLAAMALALSITARAGADPLAERVSPQRLTLFVGQGEQRVRIEGSDLEQVDKVVAYDTATTGQRNAVPEVSVRILNATDESLTLILRADSPPANGQRLQLALMFGGQGYMIPANLFQMDVR